MLDYATALTRLTSRVHSPRKAGHKHVVAKSRPVPREKSEGDIRPLMVRTTEPIGGKVPCFNGVERGET